MPRDLDYHRVQDCLESVKGVKSVHGLTVWCLTLEKNALAVHLAAGKLKIYLTLKVTIPTLTEDKFCDIVLFIFRKIKMLHFLGTDAGIRTQF